MNINNNYSIRDFHEGLANVLGLCGLKNSQEVKLELLGALSSSSSQFPWIVRVVAGVFVDFCEEPRSNLEQRFDELLPNPPKGFSVHVFPTYVLFL